MLSLTVFLNLVAETLPQVSDAIPLLGTTEFFQRANVRERNPAYFRSAATYASTIESPRLHVQAANRNRETKFADPRGDSVRRFWKSHDVVSVCFFMLILARTEKATENRGAGGKSAREISFVRAAFIFDVNAERPV